MLKWNEIENGDVLKKYYEEVTDVKSLADEYGFDSVDEMYFASSNPYYTFEHVGFIIAKDEYSEALGDNALELFEVVRDKGSKECLAAYSVGVRVYSADVGEILSCVEGSQETDDDDDF